mmetsp:Transcript_20290/g.47987  ORF Transcript_20290/g.47987 Transcript_20290/m.47987 type:complete len:159 (+) Transcript_20290:46-522(+)
MGWPFGAKAVEPQTVNAFLGVPAVSLFGLLNNLALPAWVLLALLPRWRTTQTVTLVPVFVYAVAYLALMSSFLSQPSDVGLAALTSLEGVSAAFKHDVLLLAGWVHYLAFDLLVGRWIVQDSVASKVPHVLVLPCLLLTLMAGPIGWLLYQVVRRIVV